MELSRFSELVGELSEAAMAVDAAALTPLQASQVVEECVHAERVCAALRLQAARRVAASRLFGEQGHTSPESWLAAAAGEPVGRAKGELETAEALAGLPRLEEAFRGGEVSPTQAALIADAAGGDDDDAERLMQAAKRGSHRRLRDECERVKAARRSEQDETERAEAVRRGRRLRVWQSADGATKGDFSLTPEAGARLLAALQPLADRCFDEALAAGGDLESHEAYLADALELLATGDHRRPATVVCTVDLEALRRGHLEQEETCEIQGVGQVPVRLARELFGDCLLKIVIRQGCDVRTVVHHRRYIDARLRTALDLRDPVCVVPDCGSSMGLEYDHIHEFGLGGPTSLENLVRLCHRHHKLKSSGQYTIKGRPGAFRWVKIDRPPPRR